MNDSADKFAQGRVYIQYLLPSDHHTLVRRRHIEEGVFRWKQQRPDEQAQKCYDDTRKKRSPESGNFKSRNDGGYEKHHKGVDNQQEKPESY